MYVIDHLVLDLDEWLELFTTFLEKTSHYDKILLTGDFDFPDLTWNSSQEPITSERNTSDGVQIFHETL